MEITEDHRREIEKRIVQRILTELENKTLTADDLPKIARFVLSTIHFAKNHDELLPQLEQLCSQWPCFKSIEFIEIGEVKRTKEHDIAQQVLQLTKAGKIEEAIALSKTMTQSEK